MTVEQERDYEAIGEDVGTDPASYGVVTDDDAGDEPTEFGMKPGEIPEKEQEDGN